MVERPKEDDIDLEDNEYDEDYLKEFSPDDDEEEIVQEDAENLEFEDF